MALFGTTSEFLNEGVGSGLQSGNRANDVKAVKSRLSQLGYFDEQRERNGRNNPFVTRELDNSIRAFQRDRA